MAIQPLLPHKEVTDLICIFLKVVTFRGKSIAIVLKIQLHYPVFNIGLKLFHFIFRIGFLIFFLLFFFFLFCDDLSLCFFFFFLFFFDRLSLRFFLLLFSGYG